MSWSFECAHEMVARQAQSLVTRWKVKKHPKLVTKKLLLVALDWVHSACGTDTLLFHSTSAVSLSRSSTLCQCGKMLIRPKIIIRRIWPSFIALISRHSRTRSSSDAEKVQHLVLAPDNAEHPNPPTGFGGLSIETGARASESAA